MRRFAPALVTFVALFPAFAPGSDSDAASAVGARASQRIAAPLRTECEVPRTLRLRRFEDGSAQLLCGPRVIVRVSSPH
jgi:hypothetical protein